MCVCVCVSIFPCFTVQPGDYLHNTSYELKTLKDTPVSCVLISSVMASWKDELKEEIILANITCGLSSDV